MIIALTGAGLAPWWPVRIMLSILGALLMVRAFITYHDYMHGAILRRSHMAWLLFHVYAALALTPPRSRRKSHNFYRLPETMAAIPELQSPLTITLSPRDIIDCFKSCVWDEDRQRMVTYREADCSARYPASTFIPRKSCNGNNRYRYPEH